MLTHSRFFTIVNDYFCLVEGTAYESVLTCLYVPFVKFYQKPSL